MKKTSNASEVSRSADQEKEFRRLVEEGVSNAIDLALRKNLADRLRWQKVIQNCNRVVAAATDAIMAQVDDLLAVRLVPVKNVPVPALEEFTVTKELLEKEFNVKWVGDNFKKLFFEKKQSSSASRGVAVHQLKENLLDKQILSELAKEPQLTLGQLLWLVKQQANGQDGPLLTNGYANTAYVIVEDEEGKEVLWSVNAYWDSDVRYWYVRAYSVEDPSGWSAGNRVLSSD